MEQNIILTTIGLDELNSFIENSIRKVFEELSSQPTVQSCQDLLSIAEASKVLNLAIPTIYGLVSNEIIPHMKKGKKLYFSKHELEEWIKSGRRKTSTEKNNEINALLIKPKKAKKK